MRANKCVDCVTVPDDQGGFQAEGAERSRLGAKQTILYTSGVSASTSLSQTTIPVEIEKSFFVTTVGCSLLFPPRNLDFIRGLVQPNPRPGKIGGARRAREIACFMDD